MILFFIFCSRRYATGMGGHYFSLLHTVHEIRKLGEACEIVCFGDMRPGAFAGQAYGMYEQTDDGWKSFEADFKSRMSACRVIHCFGDEVTHWIDRRVHDWGIPIVTTKPGRPPLKPHQRRFRNMIFFQSSEFEVERRRAFLSPMRYNPAFIPQRISRELLIGTGRRSPFHTENSLKILRVGRFVPEYAVVVEQSVNLARKLRDHGRQVELSVVGIKQDAGVLEDLHRKYGDEANFLTDDEFTFRAGELIEFSDVVVGTGRSAMEAVMMRKSTFVSGSDASLPIFLDRHSFDVCAKHNFSTRTPAVGGCDPEASFERFFATLQSAQEAQRHAEFLDQTANNQFDAAVGAKLTLDYYATCRTEPAWALQKFEAWQSRKRRGLSRRLTRIGVVTERLSK